MRYVIDRRVFPWLACCLLAGCGSAAGQVSGKITFKSQPVPDARIAFKSLAEADHEFFGVSNENGEYQVSYRTFKGLPAGRYTVTINRHVLRGGKSIPTGEKGISLIDAGKTIQQAFTFEKDIVAGANTLDFELSTGTKKIIMPEPENIGP